MKHRTIWSWKFPNATSTVLIGSGLNFMYEDIGYHGGIQVIAELGNQPSFTKFLALWNLNMGIDGKIVKCGISRKWLMIWRNRWKFGAQGVLWFNMWIRYFSFLIAWVWGHLVHFAIFPLLRSSKRYSFNSFHQISTKLYTKYCN